MKLFWFVVLFVPRLVVRTFVHALSLLVVLYAFAQMPSAWQSHVLRYLHTPAATLAADWRSLCDGINAWWNSPSGTTLAPPVPPAAEAAAEPAAEATAGPAAEAAAVLEAPSASPPGRSLVTSGAPTPELPPHALLSRYRAMSERLDALSRRTARGGGR